MTAPIRFALAAILLLPLGGLTAKDFTSLHPEESLPDSTEQLSPGPYDDFIKRVQEKLRAQGFDPGPVNGDFGTKTQAALAQFQLSQAVPASGQLDDLTLGALGLQREQSSDGASAGSGDSAEATAQSSSPQSSTQ